jgi:hypothetical protein
MATDFPKGFKPTGTGFPKGFRVVEEAKTPEKPPAPTLTPEDRRAWATALPGTPEGQRVRQALATKYGGTKAIERLLDPTSAWMGENVMPLVPYALTASVPGVGVTPTLTRLAMGGLIGEGLEPGVKGAAKGVAGQLLGEAGPAGVTAVQRVTGRAYRALGDRLATELMAKVKQAVPWFTDLPEGHEGIRALVGPEGTAILDRVRAGVSKALGDPKELFAEWQKSPMMQQALRSYNEGKALIDGLRKLKALDPKTGRLDPYSLVTGALKAAPKTRGGSERLLTVWETALRPDRAPRARSAIKGLVEKAAPEGEAPFIARRSMPWFRFSRGGESAGEGAPPLSYTRNVPATTAEQAYRRLAPGVAGFLSQATPFPELGGEIAEAIARRK